MCKLIILQVCLEEKDYVTFMVIFKTSSIEKRRKDTRLIKIDQHTKLQDVPSGIMYLLVWQEIVHIALSTNPLHVCGISMCG